MATLQQLKKRLLLFQGQEKVLGIQAISKNQNSAVELQVEQQLSGKEKNGKTMPDYSPVSVNKFGKTPGPITLRDTGAFQRDMYMKVNESGVLFNSNDEKSRMLEERFAQFDYEIFGLNNSTKSEFIKNHVKPTFITDVKSALKL